MGYTLDISGGEQYRAYVLDTLTKRELVAPASAVDSIAWYHSGLYLTNRDRDKVRPCRVLRWSLDGDCEQVYYERDPKFFVNVSRTRDGNFVLVTSASKTESELGAFAADDENAGPALLAARRSGVQFFADHAAGRWFAATNADGADDLKVLVASDPDSGLSAQADTQLPLQWQEFLPARPGIKIEDIDIYEVRCSGVTCALFSDCRFSCVLWFCVFVCVCMCVSRMWC